MCTYRELILLLLRLIDMNILHLKLVFLNITIFLSFGCNQIANQETSASATPTADDQQLFGIIAANNLTALTDPAFESADLVLLGETLFSDQNLSGNRNISCLSCHSTSHGTGDAMPFSVGTGATGEGPSRRQINGESLPTTRNSPPIYNLGRPGQNRAFWDGRVALINGTITSSVTEISGTNPTRADIRNVFTNVYDLQPLFPLLSNIEMLGSGNDLALHSGNIAIWEVNLSDRLLTNSNYVQLFNRAFPSVAKVNLNPGHIGRALGAFMKTKFKATNTPFDNYLKGSLTALTDSQKRGMILFYGKGQCVRCHSGSNFSDQNFHSVAAPQIGFSPFSDDTGREASSGSAADRYKFKTPSLRNVSLTAPYMHNGAFDTLEAVVKHYSNVQNSLANYSIPSSYQNFYQTALIYDSNSTRNQTRINQIDVGQVRNGLGLSPQEQTEIVDFLRNALRDPNFD